MANNTTVNNAAEKVTYDDGFFDYISLGSQRSARLIAPIVFDRYPARTVCDIGSGRGAWLVEWERAGASSYLGVDGDYVNPDNLMIPRDRFVTKNLTQSFDLGQKFDLVTSLEVGEHIVPEATDTFVNNLCRHSDAILFSAATPGQGGTFHVNEQRYQFWRECFASRGYRAFDLVRPKIATLKQIEPWYRYNSLFFARGEAIAKMTLAALQSEIKSTDPVPDWSPLSWRARKAVIRTLPVSVTNWLIEKKHKYVIARGK